LAHARHDDRGITSKLKHELWQYVGCKQKRVTQANVAVKGDQYTFVALAASTKAIIAYRTGKRDSENTDLFIRDLRERVRIPTIADTCSD
jgi:IS1 family transposase